MELNLQPQAAVCNVTGRAFAEDDRVASYLVRGPSLEIVRFDLLEAHSTEFAPAGVIACRWVHVYQPRLREENADRRMKLTAENLLLNLVDPLTVQTEENTRLIRFLALMLERKRLIRSKGTSPDGARIVYEHVRTKQQFEVLGGDLDPAFFLSVSEQLGFLIGTPSGESTEASPAGPQAVV